MPEPVKSPSVREEDTGLARVSFFQTRRVTLVRLSPSPTRERAGVRGQAQCRRPSLTLTLSQEGEETEDGPRERGRRG